MPLPPKHRRMKFGKASKAEKVAVNAVRKLFPVARAKLKVAVARFKLNREPKDVRLQARYGIEVSRLAQAVQAKKARKRKILPPRHPKRP